LATSSFSWRKLYLAIISVALTKKRGSMDDTTWLNLPTDGTATVDPASVAVDSTPALVDPMWMRAWRADPSLPPEHARAMTI